MKPGLKLYLPFLLSALWFGVPASGAPAEAVPAERAFPGSQAKAAIDGNPKIGGAVRSVVSKLKSDVAIQATGRAGGFAAASSTTVQVNPEGSIQVYLYLETLDDDLLEDLRLLDVEVELINRDLLIIQAWVPFQNLDQLAVNPKIKRVTAPKYGRPQSGSVLSEGDAILLADQVRSLGFTGAGVKVGVISDGANARAQSQATGDLPANIASYGFCSTQPADYSICRPERTCNEGTAMLEIIHDIAPDAELAIASVNTSLEFIQHANTLVNSYGAQIVVDDLSFFAEPYFEDGPIALGVAALTSQALFVSAAGNSGLGHYEAEYISTTLDGEDFHNFGAAAGGSKDATMDVSIPPGQFLLTILQWNDPFGGSGNDYDLYLGDTSETELLCPTCYSEEIQIGSEDPIEGICYYNSSGSVKQGRVAVNRWTGAGRRIELFLLGGSVNQYNNPQGSIFGHAAVADVLSVATINADDPGADTIAPYSSQGPARIDFPTLQNRQKPELTGIDAVSVSGAGGFPTTFYGTSAAAPHVAGVAALIRSIPGTTLGSTVSALLTGAVDLGAAGFDSVYGYGRTNALGALQQFDSDADGLVDAVDPDDDNDGMPDSFEIANGLDPLDPDDAAEDSDGDGLSNLKEFQLGTEVNNPDTDGDGVSDGDEVKASRSPKVNEAVIIMLIKGDEDIPE